MTNATKRSGAPKHRRAWRATTVTVQLHEALEPTPFEVQAGGHVYYRARPGGSLRRVRDPRIVRLVHAKLRAKREGKADA
jgi:hypothetical protein